MTMTQVFAKGKAFIAYICAGDGGMDYTVKASRALEQSGVDIIELGIPFSDPVADGPIIQKAVQRSLKQGTTPWEVLSAVREIRRDSTMPILLFSYYNPLLATGYSFYEEAKKAGVTGILIVDLPPEEAQQHIAYLQVFDLSGVFLVTPATADARIREISQVSSGFLYYVCRKGITGVRKQLPEGFTEDVMRVRRQSKIPIAAGFGIADHSSAKNVLAAGADGFVVGSAFVKLIEQGASPEDLGNLARNIDPR